MRFKLIWLSLIALISASNLYARETENSEIALLQEIKQCRTVLSVLERLECYDKIALGENIAKSEKIEITGVAWRRANEQENMRKENSTQFIMTQSGKTNPTILLTTPALGYHSTRPILMFSCIDNITRLQVALSGPVISNSVNVKLITEKNRLSSQWFVREDYFLLEASRGLDGIKEIQQLFNAETLKIQAKNKEFTDLVFNIKGLENEIKPLREACHW